MASALVLVAVACSPSAPSITVKDAMIPVPLNPDVAALYLLISNSGAADELVGVTTSVSDMAHLHRSYIKENGTAGMESLDTLPIDEGSTIAFKSGGYHLMIMDPEPLVAGDTVEVTLSFKTSAAITVDAEVVESLPEADDE